MTILTQSKIESSKYFREASNIQQYEIWRESFVVMMFLFSRINFTTIIFSSFIHIANPNFELKESYMLCRNKKLSKKKPLKKAVFFIFTE